MSVYHGTKPIEFEKGRPGIAVTSKDKLLALIDGLINAVRAGELERIVNDQGQTYGLVQKLNE
jgi:hypothetical protein